MMHKAYYREEEVSIIEVCIIFQAHPSNLKVTRDNKLQIFTQI